MKTLSTLGASLAALILTSPAGAAPPAELKPVPSVALVDPKGDISSENGPGNDRDVVALSLGSDGTAILVKVTIAEDEHGNMAGGVVDFLVDTDHNAKTGGTSYWGRQATPPWNGFEYKAVLGVCTAFDDTISACAGGGDKPPKSRFARLRLDRFKGAPGADIDMMSSETVINDFGYVKDVPPLVGRVLEAKIPYDQLGVKTGQVIRIAASETAQPGAEGFFPAVLLTLK